MNEEKEIEFNKVLDLVYTAVDFDYFDDYKFLTIGSMEDPTNSCDTIIYFYGYSNMTSKVWFYSDIYIRNGKLWMSKNFVNTWEKPL